MKVVDLEKFALEQIFRPYQNIGGFGDITLKELPMSIDEILPFAKTNPEWWAMVVNRIMRIKVQFPPYVQHPLVDFFNNQSNEK